MSDDPRSEVVHPANRRCDVQQAALAAAERPVHRWRADGELAGRAAGAAVGQLLGDPALASRIGAAGRDDCGQRFLIDRQLREYLDVFTAATEPALSPAAQP